ncbi:LytTR family transcriptional regulator DNA-binding domain-containing protein [Cohnella sp. LGH]|uniref:LytTR family transcriptional regulator DNA-binding domain-containing protein n=1 Tax=Cohnella sp. LGH TaxID=1619153 RepID=UPI001ADD455E|nr:LytTR family transcriptional regulator DNA-binding domain-containing protein [Cohnella sp. LGH]QTH44989.1 LytTR family transcriptional regulator DNA-binding domain-containing protein [Cohnella sp. LGH]
MKLIVSNNTIGAGPFVELPVEDILYFEFDRKSKMITLHSLAEQFYMPGTLIFWQNGLLESGYEFVMLDRNNAVNLSKLRYVDQVSNRGYFEDDISPKSKHCTISIANIAIVKQRVATMSNMLVN